MKAKRYRIGNLVKYDNRIFEIHTIAEEFPTLDTIEFGIGVVDWNNIKPIKLTDEWLLELGFKKQSNTYWISLSNLKAELHFECYAKDMVLWLKSDNSNLILDPLKYVHQLQNLFFALSGEELETECVY